MRSSPVRHQYHLLLLAISFLTRIPVKLSAEIKPEMLHQASRYFPLVGLLQGSILVLAYALFSCVFEAQISLLLVMALSLLLTGAFHEDGWADVWDGFGGGWQVADKLKIMKDSRLGTYGACALILALAIKYQALMALSPSVNMLCFALIAAQVLSRVMATSLITALPYVSEDATSKAKPVVMAISATSLKIILATGAVTLLTGWALGLFSLTNLLALVALLAFLRLGLKAWFKQQLGGYTGDCLGAAQQVSELAIYLFLLQLLSPATGV